MKKVFPVATLFIILSSIISCDFAPKRMAKAYFYSSRDHDRSQVLFIDGKNSGQLPYLAEENDEKTNSIINNALEINLVTGKYELQVKNESGRIISEGMLELKKSAGSESVTTSWDKGADCKVKVVYQ